MRRGAAVTTPASFALLNRSNNGPARSLQIQTANDDMHGSFKIENMRDIFQNLAGSGDINRQGSDNPKFNQSLDLTSTYRNRVVPIFSDFVTAALLNARNNFITDVLSPLWETSEINFSINRKEFNQVEFKELAAGGIPDEQTHFEYGWSSTVRKVKLGARIEQDLALDENFGAQAWMDELANLASNALLTIHKHVIYTLIQIGYRNITEDKASSIPMNVHKLYQAEAEAFFIMALDPERGIAMIRALEEKIPGLDTIVIPHGSSRYLREVQGEQTSMLSQRLSTDPTTNRIMIEFADGPDSYKSLKLGDRRIGFMELAPFYTNTLDTRTEQPLTSSVTICQAHPPNPNVTAFDPILKGVNSSILDTYMYYQTKTKGEERAISMRERMTNANYWDPKTGKVLQTISEGYVKHLNEIVENQPEAVPWPWNESNPHYRSTNGRSDINEELGADNNVPDLEEIADKTDLHEMRSWRPSFCGVLYLPSKKRYTIPKRFGCFHCFNLPNEWVEKAAGYVAAESEKAGLGNLDAYFQKATELSENIKNAPISIDYVQAVIDKNVSRMMGPDGKLLTSETPNRKHYDGGAKLREFKQNRFGSLDLPDKTQNLRLSIYPNGFDFGAGWQTLAQEVLNENTGWKEAGEKAFEVVTFFKYLLKVVREFIGKTDTNDERMSPPWIHKDDALNVLIDSFIGRTEPVFFGIPNNIDYVQDDDAVLVDGEGNIRVAKGKGDSIITGNGRFESGTIGQITTTIDEAVKSNTNLNITNREKFLSCLNDKALREIQNVIRDDKVTGSYEQVLHLLQDNILVLTKYTTKDEITKADVQTSSIIVSAFTKEIGKISAAYKKDYEEEEKKATEKGKDAQAQFEKRYTTDPSAYGKSDAGVNALAAFVKALFAQNNAKKFNELKKSMIEEEGMDSTDSFYVALKNYEKKRVNFRSGEKSSFTKKDTFKDNSRPVKKARTFQGDYNGEPEEYLRAAFMSSEVLRDFMTTQDTQWVIPADANVFYEVPEDVRSIGTRDVHTLPTVSVLSVLSRSRMVESRLASRSSSRPSFETNVFDSLKSKKSRSMSSASSSSKFDVSSFLGMGENYKNNDISGAYARKQDRKEYSFMDDEKEEQNLHEALSDEYEGPWEARLAYADTIASPTVRFFFMNILEAPNVLSVPVNLAKCGAQIFEVMMVRPFIECKTNSMLALQSGAQTAITTIGHSSVMVTKEARGIFHISCGFFHSMIPVNPKNVILIPYAFPHSFIGGKKVDFMTNFEHWGARNPNKESIIAFLIPVSERIFASPLHMCNDENYITPDIDSAIWERKCSGFHIYKYLAKMQQVESVDQLHTERESYHTHVPISHVAHIGPTSYISHKSLRKEDINGSGPSGDRVMNMEGAHEVWEGKSVKFGQIASRYQNQNY